ncbi:MAG: hypothetical protein MR816_08130 [Blautia sp.]|nr:hypothetical protein [Blautia sp.]
MIVLDRLKLELSNKEYFSDEQYIQFLTENSLTDTDIYDKSSMQRNLLLTVLDVLEAVSNDVDIMRSVQTEFSTESAAYKWMANRIQQVKDKIATIPDSDEEENSSCFSLMFTREPVTRPPYVSGTRIVSNDEIDSMINRG